MTGRFLHILVLVAGLCSTGIAATDNLDPETERKSLKIADGWEINLFASDPMIEKPIEMNWDNRGRMWVATSQTYPQVKPGETPDDKIVILEDTAGKGVADKSTIFADHLFIPTAVAPGDGGAYVTNTTEILHFDEIGNTGKSTNRRVVLSGFGSEDTHQIVHTLRWGFDGRLYFNQSIYIHSRLVTPWGPVSLLGSGTWRFAPRSEHLDILSRGLINPWGIVFDRWGRTFETDGAGFGGVSYIFPGIGCESAVGVDKVMDGLNLKSPKYASAELLTGRHIPDDYQGDLLTNDFRAHRMVRFKLSRDGAGFRSDQMPDFITSTDVAFRPVDIKMGPDGAIYIADWYNPIIQHGEVDFRDPRRDHTHGRIWRVTAKGRPLVDRPTIAGASVPAILDLLKLPEDYTRLHAKLELRERGAAAVVPALSTWVNSLSAQDPNYVHNLLEALWTYQSVDSPNVDLLNRLLKSHVPEARAAAVRVASRWADQLPDSTAIFSAAVDDDDPAVRLEGVCALAQTNSAEAMPIAARALAKPRDKFIDYAVWAAANDLKAVWLPAFTAGKLTDWADPSQLRFSLEAIKSPAAITALVSQLQSNQLPPEARGEVIDLIAAIDPKGQVDALFNLALAGAASDPATTQRLLSALARMSVDAKVQPAQDPGRIATLFDASDPLVKSAALRLAGDWHLEPLRGRLTDIATAAETPPGVRLAAMDALASLGGDASRQFLQKLAEPPTDAVVRRCAAAALAGLDLQSAAASAAKLLAAGDADADPGILLAAFIHRDNGSDALASALAGQKISVDSARLALRYLQSQGNVESSLGQLLQKSAGLSSGPTKLTPDQMKQTIADVLANGDAARGERIFRRREQGCYQCHAINGAGGFLAPDLGSIGASSPADYLIDSVLDPNKAIKDGFMGYTIVTKSGDVFNGIKVRQDAANLVIRDNLHEEIVIPLSSIRRQKEAGSLMPTGLADTLTHGEFVDLIRFLYELGRPGPYGPGSGQVAHRWRVLDAVPAEFAADSAALPPDLDTSTVGWSPLYSLASGDLPTESLAATQGQGVVVVQCQIHVTEAGSFVVHLNAADGIRAWSGGKEISGTDAALDLQPGVTTLLFRIDLHQRGQKPLRVSLENAKSSTGRAEFVAGR